MKTLFIATWFMPDTGGSITIYNNVYSRYPSKEIVVLTKTTCGWREFDRKFKIPVYRLPAKRYIFLRPESLLIYAGFLVYSLFLVLLKRVKLVHCDQVLWAGLIGYLLKIILKTPYVVYAHGEEITMQLREKEKVMRKIYNSADFIIANSSYTESLLLKLGVCKDKIKIVHPGIDAIRFNPSLDPAPVIMRHGLQNKTVLLTVSRLEERKGHDMVIRALPGVLAQFPDLMYLIVGAGEEDGRLKSLVEKLNLKGSVIFAGKVDEKDLPLYYCCCDIFIMANREVKGGSIEGFGEVFIEAAACGKPAIGGDSGGVRDAILNDETGFLVNPNDIGEISQKIISLLRDKELSRKLGMQARQRAEIEFNWDLYYKKVNSLEEEGNR